MTLDPAAAKNVPARRSALEKLWIVTVSVGPDNVSAWYTSIARPRRSYWPKVPALIDTIRVI